jgi:hypothetical protein
MRLRMTRSVDAGGVGANDGNGLAFADVDAVEDFGVGDDLEAADGTVGHFGEEREEGGDATDSGDDAGLFGDDSGGGAQGGIDGEGRGDVVGGLVLEQDGFQDRSDAAGFPIHALMLNPERRGTGIKEQGTGNREQKD